MSDFNYDDYIEVYPPYRYALRDIRNISDFTFIKNDFQILWKYLQEINSLLGSLEEAVAYIQYMNNEIKVRIILTKIQENIEKLRNIIGNIRIKIKRIPNYQTFDYYLNRIDLEVLGEIEASINDIQYKIKNSFISIGDLYRFIREAREKFEEFKDFVNEILMHI